MAISKEFVQSVRNSIATEPDIALDDLARRLNTSEADVITALPVAMRQKARVTALDAIWSMLSRWEALGHVLHGPARQSLPLASGLGFRLLRHGKLSITDACGGFSYENIRDSLGSIWFISRAPDKHCITFLDKEGGHLLSVSPAPGAHESEDQGQLADFEDMKKRFGVIPMPKNRCKGCAKGCNCQAAGG